MNNIVTDIYVYNIIILLYLQFSNVHATHIIAYNLIFCSTFFSRSKFFWKYLVSLQKRKIIV